MVPQPTGWAGEAGAVERPLCLHSRRVRPKLKGGQTCEGPRLVEQMSGVGVARHVPAERFVEGAGVAEHVRHVNDGSHVPCRDIDVKG